MNSTCIEERGLIGYHVVINGEKCESCQSTNFSFELDQTSELDLTKRNALEVTSEISLQVGFGGIILDGVDIGKITCLYSVNVPVVLSSPKLGETGDQNPYKLVSQVLVSPFSSPKSQITSQTSNFCLVTAFPLLIATVILY